MGLKLHSNIFTIQHYALTYFLIPDFFGALRLSFSSIDDGMMVDRHYQVRQLSRAENSIDGLGTDALLLMDLRPPFISNCSTFSETMSLHEKTFHLIQDRVYYSFFNMILSLTRSFLYREANR